jgi:hypothetical protein
LSPKPPTLTPGPTNWNKFQVLLGSRIDLHVPLKTSDDIDSAVHNFTQHTLISESRGNQRRRVSRG